MKYISLPIGFVGVCAILATFLRTPIVFTIATLALLSFWAGWLVVREGDLSLAHAAWAGVLLVLANALVQGSIIFLAMSPSDPGVETAAKALGTSYPRLFALAGYLFSCLILEGIPAALCAIAGGILARKSKLSLS